MASASLNELQGDVAELESILSHVTRSNVRSIIANEISTLKSKIEVLEKQEHENTKSQPLKDSTQPNIYTTKISTYGFDESNKFVKIYVNLKECDKLTTGQTSCDFNETSFKFVAQNHLGKNHQLQIVKLAYKIIPSQSTCKVKSDMVVISLRKAKDGQKWEQLTEAERKAKEAKDSRFNEKNETDTSDPSGGIMNLMKKMYDEGDDDMKRMIKKTWYETQQKQQTGETPSMPPMPGL